MAPDSRPDAAGPTRFLGVVETPDMLRKVAQSLRTEVGPAVERSYPKTQTFMAAVILERLAGQLEAPPDDSVAAGDGRLGDDVAAIIGEPAPASLSAAVDRVNVELSDRTLGQLVAALYGASGDLGLERFEAALRRVRTTLRRRLDRQLAALS